MPIKIHHGPPGSFKTAGAMSDDFLREAREGRVIVTNVRGVSRERTLAEFPDLPDSFDVIWVDDKTKEGREKWARWFHWVPRGAFLFVDEIQDIWPKSWRQSDIDILDYPGGVEKAGLDDRPHDWSQAFDKHRHWNWDMVLTTPSYKKVRDDIKGVADAAYKHKDLALIGWTGRYIEAMHLADDEGKSQSDFLTVENKKVPSYVFKLYDSTATGKHRTNKNGFNLFASPRILILLLVLVGSLGYSYFSGPVKLFPGATPETGKSGVASASSPSAPSSKPSGPVSGDSVLPSLGGSSVSLRPFEGEGVYIVMSANIGTVWKYVVSFQGYDFTNRDILDMGYSIKTAGACGMTIRKGDFERFITCGVDEKRQQKQVTGLAVAPGAPVPVNQNPVGTLVPTSDPPPVTPPRLS